MEIIAGLSALKTAADLAKSLWDAAKAGSLRPDEFSGRIAEVYDYIIDSKEAVLGASEQLARLVDENGRLKTYVFHHSVNWRTLADGTQDGPFCPTCVSEGFDMRLALNDVADQTGDEMHFRCLKSHVARGEGRDPHYRIPRQLIPPDRYFIRS
ncbi:MAG: hypothetical protein ABIR70_07380 [Bryobacteraceae bacterium]